MQVELNNGWGEEPYFFKGAGVSANFGNGGFITEAIIIAFHSYGDKHKYDIEVKCQLEIDGLTVDDTARLYNVDGRFLQLI